MDVETNTGITGYWTIADVLHRCSVCRALGRVFRIECEADEFHVCKPCGIALREMLIDALEDEEA